MLTVDICNIFHCCRRRFMYHIDLATLPNNKQTSKQRSPKPEEAGTTTITHHASRTTHSGEAGALLLLALFMESPGCSFKRPTARPNLCITAVSLSPAAAPLCACLRLPACLPVACLPACCLPVYLAYSCLWLFVSFTFVFLSFNVSGGCSGVCCACRIQQYNGMEWHCHIISPLVSVCVLHVKPLFLCTHP